MAVPAICVTVADVSVEEWLPAEQPMSKGHTSGSLQIDSQLHSYVLTVLPKELPLG